MLFQNFQYRNASPIFFYNPFSVQSPSSDESENVSVYTTTPKNSSSQIVTESPTVYQQIASNVLERIASHFIAPSQSGRILSTTGKPVYAELEIFEDSPEEFLEKDNNDSQLDKEDEVDDKELINPKYIDANPSFKVIPMRRLKPERLTFYGTSTTTTEKSDEDDDEDSNEEQEETNPTNDQKRDFTENGLFRILETIASVITIVSGAISALFKPMTE